MSRKRDLAMASAATAANYIDHSYADQSPKAEEDDSPGDNNNQASSSCSSPSSSSYNINSDHSYHVSTSKTAKSASKSSNGTGSGGHNGGGNNKKVRKSTRFANRASSTTTTTSSSARAGKSSNNDHKSLPHRTMVASTVDQVTSSSGSITSAQTALHQHSHPQQQATILFGDDGAILAAASATSISCGAMSVLPSPPTPIIITTAPNPTTMTEFEEMKPQVHHHQVHPHPNVVTIESPPPQVQTLQHQQQQPQISRLPSSQPHANHPSHHDHQMVNAMDEAFGRFVVSCLRGMSPPARNNARHAIMQVLNECMTTVPVPTTSSSTELWFILSPLLSIYINYNTLLSQHIAHHSEKTSPFCKYTIYFANILNWENIRIWFTSSKCTQRTE